MSLITVDLNKCNHDGLCTKVCPVNIIKLNDGIPYSDKENEHNCIECGHCVAICPKGALTHSTIKTDIFLRTPENIPEPSSLEALLLSRRSTRIFKRKPIDRLEIEKIIDIARCAPTASNSQNIFWTVIFDPKKLEIVKKLTLEWIATDPKRSYHLRAAESGYDVVLRGAPTLAIAHSPENYLWTETDCAIALTYMELLATSKKYGVCWGGLVTIAARQNSELQKILGVPADHKIGGAMMLGRPNQKYKLIPPRNKANVNWI
ncbi:nitroreductase family protein [Maridesulfovibrio bastinii]|uniref:nitroreductase family protein n=1 Tax=Maridesulfovibrio bastinii TaxID=47157 RepID=UPI000408084C|nr:nitroreductase family protein [Maridesulfovibrio bastinii]